MYTNGNGGNGNGNGNGHKREKLTLPRTGTIALDEYPEVLGEQGPARGSGAGVSSEGDAPRARGARAERPSPQMPEAEGTNARPVLDDGDAPASAQLLDADERRGVWKRRFVGVGIALCGLLLLVITVVGYLWLFAGGADESYRVRTPAPRDAGGAANGGNSPSQPLTAEEIARELNKGGHANNAPVGGQELTTTPGSPTVTTRDGTNVTGGSPVTDRLPLDYYSTTVSPNGAHGHSQTANSQTAAATTTTAGQSNQTGAAVEPTASTTAAAARPGATASTGSPNPERSIRVGANMGTTRGGVNTPPPSAGPDIQTGDASAGLRGATGSVALPSFGAMLPVRTLGTFYTLRSEGYVRMQVTRAVSGGGWSLARGTELFGTIRNSDFEVGRAYVQLVGFIDGRTGGLVRLQGNLLGADGADGLRGRKHDLNSGWSRAMRIAGAGVIEALSTVAATAGRRPVYVGDVYGYGAPRATSPLMQELNGVAYRNNRAGFVEVPAGTAGYVLVTTSPREIQGVDADVSTPVDELRRLSDAGRERAANQLSEAELAELMTKGSQDDVRRALPRMTPEMRRVAEAMLAGQ